MIYIFNSRSYDLIGFRYFTVKEILKLCPARMLVTLYKVPSFDSVDDFLQKVATVRGKLKKGGIVDVDAAARIVLHNWNEGMTLFASVPLSCMIFWEFSYSCSYSCWSW